MATWRFRTGKVELELTNTEMSRLTNGETVYLDLEARDRYERMKETPIHTLSIKNRK